MNLLEILEWATGDSSPAATGAPSYRLLTQLEHEGLIGLNSYSPPRLEVWVTSLGKYELERLQAGNAAPVDLDL